MICGFTGATLNKLYTGTFEFFRTRNRNSINAFINGIKKGIPIALGYIPVSFTFGMIAVNGGLAASTAIIVSLTNLTSAGQFAGVGLIIANAPLFEIAITTFVINIRYMLMSLSLSQKICARIPLLQRCILAFGITDETFAVSSLEKGEITFPFMMGLITCPYFGWALGTALGAVTTSILPKGLQNAMGIALYAMFIALVVPAAKKSKAALLIVMIAVTLGSIFKWVPYVNRLSGGWSIIIASVAASAAGALLFPRKEDSNG